MAKRSLSTNQEIRWPIVKRQRDVQYIFGSGLKWGGWRGYGTQVTSKPAYDPTEEPPTAPAVPPKVIVATGTGPEANRELQSEQATPGPLNHLWRNDLLRRGRGKSWFTAWRSIDEEEADNTQIPPDKELKTPREALGGSRGEEGEQSRTTSKASDPLRHPPTAEEENIKLMRASPSFKKDLASLDAGLLHNPASGTVTIDKEIEPQQVRDEDQSIANNDTTLPSSVHMSKGTTVPLDPELETTFQRYQKKFGSLLFQPWRPFTSINLDLDPEGEYVDPDMGHYAPIKPEEATETVEEVVTVPEPRLENETIHVLGLGPVGKYVAHTLAGLPDAPPITLLMHRPLVMQHWHDEGAAIRLVRDGELHVQSIFNIESAASFRREHPDQVFPHFGRNLEHSAEPPDTIIDTLIVTTDPWTTIPALEAIKNRIRQRTTICFIQEGLGIAERVSAEIFTDPDRRPTYILGGITHKIGSTDRHFTIVEQSSGVLTFSKLPTRVVNRTGNVPISRHDFSWSPQARHLAGSLTRATDLNSQALGHKSFHRAQLQKVVMGCVIGPLSVMYDCSNDQLLYDYNASLTMKHLLKEISQVICALPELKTLHGIYQNFNAKKLEAICVSAIAKTGKAESSMLRSVRAGRRTNIDFYNGYIVRRGAQLGIPCPRNEMIMSMVKGKRAMKSRELNEYIPMIASS